MLKTELAEIKNIFNEHNIIRGKTTMILVLVSYFNEMRCRIVID